MKLDLEKLQAVEGERRAPDAIYRARNERPKRCRKCIKQAMPCRKCMEPDDVLVKKQPRLQLHCIRCKKPLGNAKGSGLLNKTGICVACQRATGARKGNMATRRIPLDQEDQGVEFTRAEWKRLLRSEGAWSRCSCPDCLKHRGKPMEQRSESIVVCPHCNYSCESGKDNEPLGAPWVARDWQMLARYHVIGWVTCPACRGGLNENPARP